ncbi:beta-propeller fold lactonase family protein [Leptospira terpstrae]|uniref:IPT/TIG domain protein n=1 Tax=Leptospira terpstrae serovar Hualin str. LT 11-33 = ATCC 700639 TaxID=1257025 RepID=N1VUY1_9LEPT|nr:beta-propeller fold lactonase family protein [Leptospira terpstrae]EMY62263.1 IPT/TIG domain protein [Leptospira terpstrae serovar Hualin str. LT 11-33 = ATCC 700639]
MRKSNVLILNLFFSISCFYHPLWKPYFFPETDQFSKLQIQFASAIFLIQPRIYSLSKTSGVEGETIIIDGINFSPQASENAVNFSGSVQATIENATNTSLTIRIPYGAKSGPITIQNRQGSSQSFDTFTVYRYFISFSVGANTELYSLNMNTGAIVANSSSPYALTSNSASFSPNGKFAYSGGFGISYISSYAVNLENGILSSLNANAGATTMDPVFFAFHPTNRFLYVSSFSGASITAFSFDQNTGILTKINDYSQSCFCSLNHLAITPDGKFLYVNGNGGTEPIIGYSVDQNTGALSNLAGSPFGTGVPNMEALLVDSTSNYLYSVASAGVIIGRQIDSFTGNLTAIPGSPFTGTTGNFRAVMHPSGKYFYTVNILGATLAKHDISTNNGSISSANSILNFGSNLQFVTLDPTGTYGFVSNIASNNFYQFKVDPTTGAPSLMNSGNPYPASATPSVPQPFRLAQ